MGYIDENLSQGEEIIFLTKRHWVNRMGWPTIFVLVGVGFLFLRTLFENPSAFLNYIGWGLIGLGVVMYGILTLLNNTVEIGVTNKRVIIKTGLVRRNTHEVILQKVESISVDQTVFGRVFNYGTLLITGSGGSSEPYTNIAKPLAFKSHVHKVVEKLDDGD